MGEIVLATNAAGAATFKYGSTREWVRRLTVVLASGGVLDLELGQTQAHPDGYFEIVDDDRVITVPVARYQMPDVAKRSAGYFAAPGMDLIELFVGSEGTLGIVTQASFAILPQRPPTCLVWVTAPEERSALDLASRPYAGKPRRSDGRRIHKAWTSQGSSTSIGKASRCFVRTARTGGMTFGARRTHPWPCWHRSSCQAMP